MNLIEFKDLPDTSTPINAEALNQMQENIENAIDEKNIIFAQNSEGYTTTSTAAEIVPLTQVIKLGNKLSVSEDGGILIGEGVNYVRTNAQINYSSLPQDGTRAASYIYRNNNNMSLSSIRANGTGSGQCVINSPVIIDVQEGDIIYLKARTNDVAGGVTASSTRTTYLYVEVVE